MAKKKIMMLIELLLVIAGSYFAIVGISMHMQVTTEEATFHEIQTDYIVTNTKSQRDSAPANSELSKQQSEIANYPSTLLMLKLVGVGKILTGIFIILIGILLALIMMPIRLGMIINENKKK